jgi:hypothetical protein
MQPEVLKSQQ